MGVDIKQVHEDEIPLLQCYAFPVCQSIQVIHLYMTQTSGREKLSGIKRAIVLFVFYRGPLDTTKTTKFELLDNKCHNSVSKFNLQQHFIEKQRHTHNANNLAQYSNRHTMQGNDLYNVYLVLLCTVTLCNIHSLL